MNTDMDVDKPANLVFNKNMNTVIFPLLSTNPPLVNVPIYTHELNYYKQFKELQGQCQFSEMMIKSKRVYSYGVIGFKDEKICTSAVILLPTEDNYYEIYSLCTSLLYRNKGCASEMLLVILNSLHKFYKYVWIGVDANLDETTFKSLIKMYYQLGFINYPSYNVQTPLGIYHKDGFIQLVKEYTSDKPTTLSKFYNKDAINLCWNSAHTKTSTLTVCINPKFIENIFKKYGHLPYEKGGVFKFERHFPQKTDKHNLLRIEYDELVATQNETQGSEEFLAVNVPYGLYNFHTHPMIGSNLFKTTFAWPSVQDVYYTLWGTFNKNLLLHLVVACEGFYVLHVTSSAIGVFTKLSQNILENVLENVKIYLEHVEHEKQRSPYHRYFKYIGWKTEYNLDGPIAGLKQIYTSPSGITYNSLTDAINSDEYKYNHSIDSFKTFMNSDTKNQIKYLSDIIKNMTLNLFIQDAPNEPILNLQSISYNHHHIVPVRVYNYHPYDVPILKKYPRIKLDKTIKKIKTIQKIKKSDKNKIIDAIKKSINYF